MTTPIAENKRPLVRHTNSKEMHIARRVPLIIVPNLKVAVRRIQVVRRERLRRTTIQGKAEDIALVAERVRELLANGDIEQRRSNRLVALDRVLDADSDVACGVVVDLANGLGGHGVGDVDLTDGSAMLTIIRLLDGQSNGHTVSRIERRPAFWVGLAQLGAAVLAVGRRDAARGRGRARDLHHQRAVAGLGEEVVVARILVAAASHKVGGVLLLRLARAADRELQGPIAQVEVAAWSAVWV